MIIKKSIKIALGAGHGKGQGHHVTSTQSSKAQGCSNTKQKHGLGDPETDTERELIGCDREAQGQKH